VRGIVHAFPIQQMCIPLALEGRDLIGQAKTGTGKTLGFGVPVLSRIDSTRIGVRGRTPVALIIVPTRELCLQVADDLAIAGADLGAVVTAIYGGRGYEPQIEALTNGVDVVVGTPGRVIDLATRRDLILRDVRTLVLDEADEMLDMGFLPDVERIVAMLPTDRQTMLFSATMPGQILSLARRYMQQPTHIRAAIPGDESSTVDAIEQHVWRAHSMDKEELLARVLQAETCTRTVVFTRTKRSAQRVCDALRERGFAAVTVHGDLGQGAREQALSDFREGRAAVLIATDVAARGIDIEAVTHVINLECPDDEKAYVHRIGRTGRAGANGVAITLVDWADIARWQMINRALGLAFPEPLETYSTSEHVYAGLGIDPSVTGRIGSAAGSAAPARTSPRPSEDTKRPRQRNRSRSGGSSGQAKVSSTPTPAAAGAPPAGESGASAASRSRSRQRRRTKRVGGPDPS
jgi:superfamily II DNA/RNA helicase